jgi:hypothetical protein
MKRALISLGVGLLLIPLMLGLLLAVKILSPNGYPIPFWPFLWPLPLLRLLSGIVYFEITAVKVLVVGLLGDYLLVSFFAYLCLTIRGRFLKRKKRVSSQPPPPPPTPFTD